MALVIKFTAFKEPILKNILFTDQRFWFFVYAIYWDNMHPFLSLTLIFYDPFHDFPLFNFQIWGFKLFLLDQNFMFYSFSIRRIFVLVGQCDWLDVHFVWILVLVRFWKWRGILLRFEILRKKQPLFIFVDILLRVGL